jgi:hypothetical protein
VPPWQLSGAGALLRIAVVFANFADCSVFEFTRAFPSRRFDDTETSYLRSVVRGNLIPGIFDGVSEAEVASFQNSGRLLDTFTETIRATGETHDSTPRVADAC